MTSTARTPIVAGFFPDPSVCRVGDTYYLANSSFEYVPGVPISTSRDLLSWTHLANALTRASQLPPHDGSAGSGIYAPTLRHHDGRFWLVTTDIGQIRRGHLIVHATDPAGPWSDPVHVAGTVGIDPDLVWDEDGTCHLTWASFHPDLQGIASAPVDPATGELLGSPRLLWPGTGLASPEGPHLYRIDGWWYLVLAEGGTERGHAVTIARSRSLDGPFEAAPSNPILSHRSTAHPVQNTGHADLVQLADGSWAMVYLGVRARGRTPHFHVNGRETFLAGVDWVDGWPVVDEDRFADRLAGRAVDDSSLQDHSFSDRFEGAPLLHPRWVAPGEHPGNFLQGGADGHLVLTDGGERRAPRLLATRTRDPHWSAQVRLDTSHGAARFVLRIDDEHWYGLTVGGGAVTIVATAAIGPAVARVGSTTLLTPDDVVLRISSRAPTRGAFGGPDEPDLVELAVVPAGGAPQVLALLDGRYLSTEVAGGFTGRVVGVELLAGRVPLLEFSYRTTGPDGG